MTQATPQLLAQLQALETELHHPGRPSTAARLEQLLHPDFHEAGRSGRRYDRQTVLRFLSTQTTPPAVVSWGFAVEELGVGCALLTFCSAHKEAQGRSDSHTLRSSLWLHTASGWQLRYHQGTPAAPGEAGNPPA